MKKIITLALPILLLTVGCTNKEQVFEDYANTYYENHMKMVNNTDEVTITIDDLKSASDYDEYNLKSLEKCDTTSKIIFTIDNTTKEIVGKKLDLKCK